MESHWTFMNASQSTIVALDIATAVSPVSEEAELTNGAVQAVSGVAVRRSILSEDDTEPN